MFQKIDGRTVKVLDFDTMPKLPITWDHPDEEPYAKALDDAIRNGIITEPGKYGIEIIPTGFGFNYTYNIFAINE